MMLQNLYTALGVSFDYNKFFHDLEIDIAYKEKTKNRRKRKIDSCYVKSKNRFFL